MSKETDLVGFVDFFDEDASRESFCVFCVAVSSLAGAGDCFCSWSSSMFALRRKRSSSEVGMPDISSDLSCSTSPGDIDASLRLFSSSIILFSSCSIVSVFVVLLSLLRGGAGGCCAAVLSPALCCLKADGRFRFRCSGKPVDADES